MKKVHFVGVRRTLNGLLFKQVLEYKYIWFSKWGNYKQGVFQPYLLACQIPKSHHTKV